MSLITKENIEIWMFNYHEELLTAFEKEQLLRFLIENPEYNEDFVLWANTHITPPNAQSVTADITKNLLQKETPAFMFPTKTIASFTGGICFAFVCMYIARSISSNTEKPIVPNRIQESRKDVKSDSASYTDKTPERILLQTKTIAATNKGMTEYKEIEISQIQDTASNSTPTTLKTTQSDLIFQEHNTPIKASDSISISKDNTEQAGLNTSEANTNVPKTNTKSSSKKKKKFSLKPAKAFNVENPNF